MVKRIIIGKSGEERLVDLVQAIERKASAGDTRPTGIKVMDDDEDFYWARPDGTEHSVREVDEGLALAEVRIEDAETSLGQTQTRLDDAEQAVTVVQGDLNTLETVTLPGAVSALEQADQAAQQELTTLDSRLTDIDAVGTGELATLRDALTAAQDAATAAQGTADDAVAAASAANQAALTAAGIADSKGKVIYSETEPAVEDRSASNLWIKPSTETTYVWNETTSTWEEITSDLLDKAAQDALDAKQAASAAQSTANSAKADAATAQAAAVAAQQTADAATLDARDAHNAAVAAQVAADEALANAVNRVVNGGFENGLLGIAGGGIEIVSDVARRGTHSWRTPGSGQVIGDAVTVEPGQVWAFSIWTKSVGATGGLNGGLRLQKSLDGGTSWSSAISANISASDDWAETASDYVVEPGVTQIRPRVAFGWTDSAVAWVDDVSLMNVTEVRAAQAAADAAQTRADEAYAEAASKLDEAQVDAKITASANGKNSITISGSAPSGDGVVNGDTWWRIDGSSNIFGQWVWSGSAWVARQIRSEVIANLDVHKLQVTGSAAMDEAVIDKLWVDGLVGKTATFNRLTISSGNMIPDPAFGDADMRDRRMNALGSTGFTWVPPGNVPGATMRARFRYSPAAQRLLLGLDHERTGEFPVTAGTKYQLEVDCRSAGANMQWRWSFDYLYDDGTTATDVFGPAQTGGGYHKSETTFPDDVIRVTPAIRVDGDGGTPGDSTSIMDFGAPIMRPMVGAVLIEDGAITTPKLTVTEEMSAEIADFMSVSTKELIVTESAVLRHSTLIGQTVVDDINVQGKLIGTDGVFTGTVDFANINVTGELLADKINGTTIEGNTIIGADITATEPSGRAVHISGDAVPWQSPLSPGPTTYYPGLVLSHETAGGTVGIIGSDPELWDGAGVGSMHMQLADATGIVVSGRVEVDGNRATLYGARDGTDGVGLQGTVEAGPWHASVSAGSGASRVWVDGLAGQASIDIESVGDITVNSGGRLAMYYDPAVNNASVEPYGAGAGYRLSMRDTSAELAPSNTSGYVAWAHKNFLNLVPRGRAGYGLELSSTEAVISYTNASGSSSSANDIDLLKVGAATLDTGWVNIALSPGFTAVDPPRYRVKAGVLYLGGVIDSTAGWDTTWQQPFTLPEGARPTVETLRYGTSTSMEPLLRITPDGRFTVRLVSGTSGSAMHLSPMSTIVD